MSATYPAFRLDNVFIVAVVFCSLLGASTFATGQDLEEELRNIDSLRSGRKTPLDEVDRRGSELLKRFSKPEEQGHVYYMLAHVHAQSGLQEPQKIIDYAKKGLSLPLDPSRKMRLYVYLGDATRVSKSGGSFMDKRKAAAEIYLRGLNEVLKHDLPEKPPPFPRMSLISGGDEEENQREMDEQLARRRQVEFVREMIMHREVLERQITSIYKRRPFDREELKEIASPILEQPAIVQELIAAVPPRTSKDDWIREGPAQAARNSELDLEDTGWGTWRIVFVVVSIAVIVGIVGLLVFRHLKSKD